MRPSACAGHGRRFISPANRCVESPSRVPIMTRARVSLCGRQVPSRRQSSARARSPNLRVLGRLREHLHQSRVAQLATGPPAVCARRTLRPDVDTRRRVGAAHLYAARRSLSINDLVERAVETTLDETSCSASTSEVLLEIDEETLLANASPVPGDFAYSLVIVNSRRSRRQRARRTMGFRRRGAARRRAGVPDVVTPRARWTASP